MRRAPTPLRISIAALALVAAGCSDSNDTSPATTPTTAPAATAAAALTPEVLCITADDGVNPVDVAFAYTNDSPDAVVVEPSASTMANAEEADAPFVPRVFAPGRLAPAFWVTATSPGSGPLPVWIVIGPDGVTRTAKVDESTPLCDAERAAAIVADTRTLRVEVADLALSADGASATFTTRLTGADASVCPEGLDPRPVQLTWDDGAGSNVTEGPTASWTVPLRPGPDSTVVRVAVLVVEQCASGATTQAIWASSEQLGELYRGVGVCIDDRDGQLVAVTSQDGSADCQLPGFTGGSRIRPA